MELSVQCWKEFNVARLCHIDMGNKFDNDKMTHEFPSVNFVSRTANNNGVSDIVDEIPGVLPYPANSVTVALGGSIGSCYLQTKPFYTGQNVSVLLFDDTISNNAKLFITTMFMNECKYKYVAFGRELNVHIRNDFTLYLPIKYSSDNTPVIDENKTYSDEGYVPDWQFMEDYIKSLHHKPITTKVKTISIKKLDVDKWKEFKVCDLFNVQYGINMELNTCTETAYNDPEGIAFVARTAENNGVSAYVKKIEGKEPQPAGTITVAGGGSVLSTFVQKRPFYSGRDLYLLLPKEDINLKVKMFISTVLFSNQYRYSYGRQANKTLPDLVLKLPIKRDENDNPIIDDSRLYSEKGYIPDWEFMEDYINSLPYSDRI